MQQLLNINTIFIGLFSLFFGYGLLTYYLQNPDPYEAPIGNLPVPIQVGKNKLIVSKTGDASMRTEYKRRRAIIGSNACGITPKFSHSGSTNGSLETYFLSSMCPKFIKDNVFTVDTIENVLSDILGQSVTNPPTTTEEAPILDGGGSNVDNKVSVFINPGGANTDYSKSKTIDFGGAR